MTTHINKTTRSCYESLREIRSIAAPLSFDVRKLLVTSFILSKIDYSNSTLVGLPAYRLEQLQRVINAAAKIINNKGKHDHVTPLLHDLHWLRICQKIDCKISSLVFKSLLGHAPSYLSFALHKFLLGVDSDRQPGASSSNHLPDVRHWMTGL